MLIGVIELTACFFIVCFRPFISGIRRASWRRKTIFSTQKDSGSEACRHTIRNEGLCERKYVNTVDARTVALF
jgi:hypothetical protein